MRRYYGASSAVCCRRRESVTRKTIVPAYHVFVDESARGQRYYVGAARIAQHDVKTTRQLAWSFCVAGQRRWHFSKERDSRRAQIIAAVVASGQVTGVGRRRPGA